MFKVVDIVVTKSAEPAQSGQEMHIDADENKEGLQEQHPAHRCQAGAPELCEIQGLRCYLKFSSRLLVASQVWLLIFPQHTQICTHTSVVAAVATAEPKV